jgi:hypothetical protein
MGRERFIVNLLKACGVEPSIQRCLSAGKLSGSQAQKVGTNYSWFSHPFFRVEYLDSDYL